MTARGRRVTAAGRDLDREAAGEPQRPPPSSALALSLQAGLGNRLTTQIIQRALLGQPRSYEQQNAEQARDRQEVDAAVREAALIEDQRMRNTARVLLSGRATVYVGTPRWNSDALVSDRRRGGRRPGTCRLPRRQSEAGAGALRQRRRAAPTKGLREAHGKGRGGGDRPPQHRRLLRRQVEGHRPRPHLARDAARRDQGDPAPRGAAHGRRERGAHGRNRCARRPRRPGSRRPSRPSWTRASRSS